MIDLIMSVVIPEVGKTEVFANDAGSISIRQTSWPDDPVIVVIPVQFVDAVVDALRAAKEDAIP